MELQEAKDILGGCVRSENRDHAFGDCEVFWTKNGLLIAEGYFGGGDASVRIDEPEGSFKGEQAHALRAFGTTGLISRNDETGPDEFVLGEVMPGLSKGDVFHELTGEYLDGS